MPPSTPPRAPVRHCCSPSVRVSLFGPPIRSRSMSTAPLVGLGAAGDAHARLAARRARARSSRRIARTDSRPSPPDETSERPGGVRVGPDARRCGWCGRLLDPAPPTRPATGRRGASGPRSGNGRGRSARRSTPTATARRPRRAAPPPAADHRPADLYAPPVTAPAPAGDLPELARLAVELLDLGAGDVEVQGPGGWRLTVHPRRDAERPREASAVLCPIRDVPDA
jgi:hypothetical protein